MDFVINIFLPAILTIGFISYCCKSYFHFLYLKIVKGYPKELSFYKFISFVNAHFFDRLEIIMPLLIKRNKESLSENEFKKAKLLEKRIIYCIILTVIGFLTIPIGLYLQNNYL